MNHPYGPWATLISAGQNPQLSAFWRRRMGMLASVRKASPALSRVNVALLAAAAAVVFAMPTFCAAPAAAQRPADATKEQAASTSGGKAAAKAAPRDADVQAGQAVEGDAAYLLHVQSHALPRPYLCFLWSVRTEVGLTAEQEKKLLDVFDYYLKSLRPPAAPPDVQNRTDEEVRRRIVAMLTPEQRTACRKIIPRAAAYWATLDGSDLTASLGVTRQQWEKIGEFRLTWGDESFRRPLDDSRSVLTAQQWEKLMTRAEKEYRKSHEPAAGDPPIGEDSPPKGWLDYLMFAEIDDDNDSVFGVLPVYEPLRDPRVRRQLGMSEAQRARLREIALHCLHEYRKLQGNLVFQPPDERKKSSISFQQKALRFTEDVRPEIEDLFTLEQLAKLKTLALWPLAAGSLATSQVQRELGLSDAQKAALARIEREKRARAASFPAEISKELLSVLTPAQRAKLSAEIDRCFE
jgi:DNA-binding MarR family transcriptional regulator